MKLYHDDGLMLYDVEFYSGSAEYEYEINAVSGAVLKSDSEQRLSHHNSSASTSDYIAQDRAKSIALERAGLSASAVIFEKVELDHGDGRAHYEIHFKSGSTEYEAEIDAVSGEILDWDSEVDDD